jgi:hypothetical protein
MPGKFPNNSEDDFSPSNITASPIFDECWQNQTSQILGYFLYTIEEKFTASAFAALLV